MNRCLIWTLKILFAACCTLPSATGALPAFDFTERTEASAWGQAHHATLQITPEGLEIRITGDDPYFSGPRRDYPAEENLWMQIELRSDSAGMAQIFFFKQGPSEENSVRFHVPAGESNLRVALPPLGPGTHLRFDPPGRGGICLLKRIAFEIRPKLTEPAWPAPPPPNLEGASSISSGPIELRHGREALGAFEIRVHGQSMAIGHSRGLAGYSRGSDSIWLEVTNRPTVTAGENQLRVQTILNDPDGARWEFRQTFSRSSIEGGIDVESSLTVSQDRHILFLPLLLLFPGVDTFGTNKAQGLFAGLEYLENEPSSSEADVIGPGALRRVPDGLKVTFPLMAIAAEDRYVALAWEQQPDVAAFFDSPDRVFRSGGHAMGLIFPGAEPHLREDGHLLPYGGVALPAGKAVRLRATIIGGMGATVVPAVQEFVQRFGLPPLPQPELSNTDFFRLAARGWLDSEIRDGARYRHAVGPSFGSMPAADAALLMTWLGEKVLDRELSERLGTAASEALSLVPAHQYNSMAVGHVRHPVQALVFGEVQRNIQTAAIEARNILRRFEPDGSVIFPVPSKGTDLGKTHFSREANGLAATQVSTLLDRAGFTGDPALIEEAIRLLRALDKFRNTVPRGAQTWEVPLHTPDILASAYLARAYLRGYELTGDESFFESARYWAWTGLPFIYLTPPNDQPVGVYSTIAVFGATQWIAPLWIGLPVQWCGLVYGDAVRRLARHDPKGPWKQLADGIALAGVQHTHPITDSGYEGLLPDSFEPRHQVRNPVPINPATLMVEAIPAYGELPLYDFHAFRTRKVYVHAPGSIEPLEESRSTLRFKVTPAFGGGARVLITGLGEKPRVRLNHREAAPAQISDGGHALLPIQGPTEITVEFE